MIRKRTYNRGRFEPFGSDTKGRLLRWQVHFNANPPGRHYGDDRPQIVGAWEGDTWEHAGFKMRLIVGADGRVWHVLPSEVEWVEPIYAPSVAANPSPPATSNQVKTIEVVARLRFEVSPPAQPEPRPAELLGWLIRVAARETESAVVEPPPVRLREIVEFWDNDQSAVNDSPIPDEVVRAWNCSVRCVAERIESNHRAALKLATDERQTLLEQINELQTRLDAARKAIG